MKNQLNWMMCIVAGILCLALGGAPLALAANNDGSEETLSTAPAMTPVPPATAAYARLVGLISASATNFVVRGLGLKEVTHPSEGVWCIKRKSTWGISKIVPSVTVEWGHSTGLALMAFYVDGVFSCPAGNIEVRTYDFGTGTPVLSDNVAFTIVVP
jgi:hypothetical protein